ncbi:MAG: hypothetical protein ABFQ95_02355 [Pseudomonadota bacterium]
MTIGIYGECRTILEIGARLIMEGSLLTPWIVILHVEYAIQDDGTKINSLIQLQYNPTLTTFV